MFCIDVWFSKRYRTTLTCANKLQICWGYVEWTLVRCSCVFFHWPRAVFKCHQPKVEILHFKNDFFQFGTPFFSLNVLRFSWYFPCSTWTYLPLLSKNFIFIHQELGCKTLKIDFLFGEKPVFNRFFPTLGTSKFRDFHSFFNAY